jgi:hypothetical protein
MSGTSRLLQRTRGLGLFGLSVVLNGGVSLISIPVVVAVVGADPWASMATGQSIGASFGVLTIFGWGLTGPVTIAMAAAASRPKIFLDSLFARGVLLVPLLGIQAAVTFAIVPHEKPVAFLAGAAMMLAGASANWYFTGESRPDRFLLLDTVPRVTGTLVGVVAVALTGELLFFALAQLAGAIVALVVSASAIFRGSRLDIRAAAHWPTITRNLREQRHGVVATAVFAAYTPAVLALIAVLVPALLPMFVLADRIGRFVAMAVSPLLQVFQGWVPSASGPELVRRIRISGWVALGTAIVAGGAYTASLPSFSELLTHGQVAFGVSATIAFGLNMTMAILSPYLTNVGLMTIGRVRAVAVSVIAGVVVSLVGLVVVVTVDGPTFTFWALVVGNLVMTVWQFVVLTGALRRAESAPVVHDEIAERVPAGVA